MGLARRNDLVKRRQRAQGRERRDEPQERRAGLPLATAVVCPAAAVRSARQGAVLARHPSTALRG